MANPDRLVQLILSHEGGASRNPKDPAAATPAPFPYKGLTGWHTVKGVTWATFLNWSTPLGYRPTAENFFTMPMEIWKRIFVNAYWNALKLGNLRSDGVAYLIGDYEWGSGVGSIKKFLIHFLQEYYNRQVSTTDQIIAALNSLTAVNERALIDNLYRARLRWLQSIKNPKTGALLWAEFGKGWQKRLDDLKAIAISPTGGGIVTGLLLIAATYFLLRPQLTN